MPGGVQRLGEPRCGSVDDLIGELMARGHDPVCVGDGALRYRDADRRPRSTAISPSSSWRIRPPRRSCSWPTPVRLREEWVNPWEIQPLYLRAPDAQINWSTRASASQGGR